MMASAKLSALGEMAAGMAHEINTPLGVIQLRATQVQRTLTESQRGSAPEFLKVQSIHDMANHIAKIVQGLRTYARQDTNDHFEAVRIGDVIADTLLLASARLENAGIKLTVCDAPDTLTVFGNRNQLCQILLNLLNNAFDAVEDLDEKGITIEMSETGDAMALSVSDSGQILSDETRERMMQPFFTTKDIGKGTGLGLSITEGIAKSHKGRLFLDPESARTRFILSLPRQDLRVAS